MRGSMVNTIKERDSIQSSRGGMVTLDSMLEHQARERERERGNYSEQVTISSW